MEKKIVVINGYPQSGKDSFVMYCMEFCQVINVSIVDCVKNIAANCGWNGKKSPKDRKFLAILKDILTEFNDLPMQNVCHEVDAFLKSWYGDVIFIAMRDPKDISKFKALYPEAITLFIDRSEARQACKNTPERLQNHADSNVEEYEYSYIIDNNSSLDALREGAATFLKDIFKEKVKNDD